MALVHRFNALNVLKSYESKRSVSRGFGLDHRRKTNIFHQMLKLEKEKNFGSSLWKRSEFSVVSFLLLGPSDFSWKEKSKCLSKRKDGEKEMHFGSAMMGKAGPEAVPRAGGNVSRPGKRHSGYIPQLSLNFRPHCLL